MPGVWDTHIKDLLGLSYGRIELSANPDGKTAHALLDIGKEFELPWGKFGIEFTDGLAWTRASETKSFQELELTQYIGKSPLFGYVRLGAADHRLRDTTTTFGLGLDVGKLFGK